MRVTVRISMVAMAGLALTAFACGGPERRPNVPTSETVSDMRRNAGVGLQDCGEAIEPRQETACKVHSVGECLAAALKACRPAFGVRQYFTAEGDGVRLDWLVLSDGHGGCDLVNVEDRSADPLAPKKPKITHCTSIVWKSHENISDCEAPVPDGCRESAAPAPAANPAPEPAANPAPAPAANPAAPPAAK